MKKLIPAIVLAVQAPLAYAGGEHEGHGPPPSDPSSVSVSVADADSSSKSSAKSSSDSASSSDSSSNSSSNSGGNSVNNTTTYQQVKRAVTGNSSGSNTTASCRYDTHAGLGSVLGGLSFGRSYKDKDCLKLQVANDLWAKGMDIAAVRVYCTVSAIKDALGDDCEAVLNEQHPKQSSDSVTHKELDNALRSASQK